MARFSSHLLKRFLSVKSVEENVQTILSDLLERRDQRALAGVRMLEEQLNVMASREIQDEKNIPVKKFKKPGNSSDL